MPEPTDYTTVEHVDSERIVVVVHHRPSASYSRSVLPRAKKRCRNMTLGQRATWALTDVDYDRPRQLGFAITVVTFVRQ